MKRLFWLSLMVGAVVTAASWFVLPDRVPLHFGVSEADQWGSRTEAVVFFALVIGGLGLLFWGLAVAVPRVPEALLNLPERDKAWWLATAERRIELNRMVREDLYAIGAATMIFFFAVEGLIIGVADDAEPSLGPWFYVMLSVYMVGVLGYTGYMVAVRYRAPRG